VGARFGLRAPPVAAVDVLCSKLGFRDFLAAAGLPRPAHVELTGPQAPADLFAHHGVWVIKPDRSSGSKGIAIVRSPDDIARRYAEAAAFSKNGVVIVEQFLDGAQGTCEGIIVDGRIGFHVVLDRLCAAPPHVATTAQLAPSRLPAAGARRLVELLDEVMARLAIRDGVFDCDFVWTGDEIILLEVTPRLGGNSISALIRAAYPGFDLAEYAVRLACDDPLPPTPTGPGRPAAARILGVASAGTLHYDEAAVAALRREPWIVDLVVDAANGAQVRAFVDGRHRVGEAIIVTASRDDLDARIAELDHRLALEVS
jgi:biotin carboxylase